MKRVRNILFLIKRGKYSDFLEDVRQLVKEGQIPDNETYYFRGLNYYDENMAEKLKDDKVTFTQGYQVSFMRPENDYSDDNEVKKIIYAIQQNVGRDIYVGIYKGAPEFSFHNPSNVINNIVLTMKYYNQESIYDWERKGIIRNAHFDAAGILIHGGK